MICDANSHLPELDTKRIHERALAAFRLGNRGRLELAECLRELHEMRRHVDLGAPDVVAYAAKHFRFRRSQTFEMVRVPRALESLPRCRSAFLGGRIDWTALKHITRVATPHTEQKWLDFVRKHNNEEVQAEAHDAIEKHRDHPRDDRFGLPNLRTRVVLKLTRAEQEKIWKAFGPIAARMSEGLDGRPVELKDVILFLAERFLARGVEKTMAQNCDGEKPRKAIVYHYCPGCRRAKMETDDGPVEVDPEEVERIAGDVHRVGIDAPTPRPLRKKVLLRDGTRCSNPWCDNAADHCHHIVYRSRGGHTSLSNEIAVCATCHALIHAGLLKVSGNPGETLHWSTYADGLSDGPRDDHGPPRPPTG